MHRTRDTVQMQITLFGLHNAIHVIFFRPQGPRRRRALKVTKCINWSQGLQGGSCLPPVIGHVTWRMRSDVLCEAILEIISYYLLVLML